MEGQIAATRIQIQLDDVLDTIEDLTDKLREFPTKRKKLIKKLDESQEKQKSQKSGVDMKNMKKKYLNQLLIMRS